MRNTIIGIVTFGNLDFTKLCVRSIYETTKYPFTLCIVVGKPGDTETEQFFKGQDRVTTIVHDINKGFPASLNDIYDHAWKNGGEDYVIIAGNDTVAYPGAVDAMIEEAEKSDMEWISASQFDVRSLVDRYPEAANYFDGPRCIFTKFQSRPWELHKDFRPYSVEPHVIKDVHNFCLFKRSVIDRIGYVDANFFPAYFSDNDYCRRATLTGLRSCNLDHAAYFHFWSRTIHQGSGGSNDRFFKANEQYYTQKWGGIPTAERFDKPFSGNPFQLHRKDGTHITCPGDMLITTRDYEAACVEWWKLNA